MFNTNTNADNVTDKIMSNNKQSSIDHLVLRLKQIFGSSIEDLLVNEIKEAKEMEKKRMIDFGKNIINNAIATWDGNATLGVTIEELYNETYGGNK